MLGIVSLARRCIAALLFVVFTVAGQQGVSAQTSYEIPVANGVPVDGCASWQAGCGQPAADQFCQTQGYAGASEWNWAYDLRTWNIGSARYCDRATDNIRCGGLRSVTCVGAADPERRTSVGEILFENPMVDGYAVDSCLNWGSGCGKPSADEFCRRMGYPESISHKNKENSPPTLVLGANQVCSESYCGRLSEVACRGN